MNNMTEEDIMKALGLCLSSDSDSECAICPCSSESTDCTKLLLIELRSLINYKNDLIKKLERIEQVASKTIEVADAEIKKLQEENKSQKAEIERFKHIKETVDSFWSELQKLSMLKEKDTPTLEELLDYIENAKSEAYREFAEKAKSKFGMDCLYSIRVINEEIDTALKELTDQTATNHSVSLIDGHIEG